MNKRILTSVTICLALLAGLAMAEPKSVGEKHIYKTLDDKELSLYIVKPDDWKAADRRPAALFFHGGGWVGGYPIQFNEHSKYGHVPYYKTILACDRFLVYLGWLKGPATLQVPAEKLAKVESYSVE